MHRYVVLALTLPMLAVQPGCATYVAVSMPGPANDESIRPGMHRTNVENVLKTGPESEFKERGVTVARYAYADSPPPDLHCR